jgi:peptidoglycan hydrolase-like protein with peptidoglycan-binding domain
MPGPYNASSPQGPTGDLVRRLSRGLRRTPGIDGDFGPRTRASVEPFQTWGHVRVGGVVGDQA